MSLKRLNKLEGRIERRERKRDGRKDEKDRQQTQLLCHLLKCFFSQALQSIEMFMLHISPSVVFSSIGEPTIF